MSEQEQEGQNQESQENQEGSEQQEGGQVEEAEDEGTTQPNEVQQPTPAGADYAQEGGPTVADQAANAMNNEAKNLEDQSREDESQ